MTCKNCHTPLLENDTYCSQCGGKVIKKRLSLRNLFEHVSETFFNYDNKLLRTLIDVFRRPELVIDGYVNGVRKRYVNPISFFGVSLTLSGLSVFIIKKFFLDELDFSYMFDSELFNNPASQEIMKQSNDLSFEYSSLILSGMIPFMAIMSILTFIDKRYNFTEHIIIYLYSMSAISIVSVFASLSILLLVPEQYLTYTLILYVAMFVHNAYILKRIFKLSALQLILRSLLFFVIFIIFYIIFSVIVAIIFLATGDIEKFKPKTS